MVKCSFTGREEHPFKGIHLIKNDGTVEYYSSSKAMKNALKLKRDKRKLKWTMAYREEKVKIAQQHEHQKVQQQQMADAEHAHHAQAAAKKAAAKKKSK